jgi:ABC-type microcin C transport system duplicated ATPase subunit YejF
MSLPENMRLRVHNLEVRLAKTGENLLDKVSFELNAGEILALVGESGSGKSVTSLAIMRLLPPALEISGGEVEIPGADIFSLSEQQMQTIRGRRVAMIFQNAQSALNPVQKVGKQVAETLRLHTRLRNSSLRQRVVDLFREVGIPDAEQRYDFYPHELSGGQQQRVMIAMALACEPDILIADEPTTALDVSIQEQVLNLIKELAHKRRLAVLLITHDMAVVKNTADQVAVMYRGRIIERGSVYPFFQRPEEAYSKQLIASLPDLSRYKNLSISIPLLTVRNIEVHFPIRKGIFQRTVDYTRAVDDVTLEIGEGETYALVGESGSGKSTLGRAILNLEKPTSGSIFFGGTRIDNLPRLRMLPFRKRIQVIFQNPHASMNPRMTVGRIIEEGMVSLGINMTVAQRQQRILYLLERVQLDPEMRNRYPHEFSGGQLQRVAIARALAVEPQLIICDEPTSALDVSIRAEVLDLLQELQTEFDCSYLFITHDLSIIPTLAHHVGVMQNGKLVEQGTAEQILTDPKHEYTKTLLNSVPRMD